MLLASVSEEAEARWDTRSALGLGSWCSDTLSPLGRAAHSPPVGRPASETPGWRRQAGLLTHFTDENAEGLRSDSASAGE